MTGRLNVVRSASPGFTSGIHPKVICIGRRRAGKRIRLLGFPTRLAEMEAGFFVFSVTDCELNNERRRDCEEENRDILKMSPGAKLNLTKAGVDLQPVRCARVRSVTRPGWANENLHLKGFVGGVPLNTETAAVKPRAGIE